MRPIRVLRTTYVVPEPVQASVRTKQATYLFNRHWGDHGGHDAPQSAY